MAPPWNRGLREAYRRYSVKQANSLARALIAWGYSELLHEDTRDCSGSTRSASFGAAIQARSACSSRPLAVGKPPELSRASSPRSRAFKIGIERSAT